MNRRCRAWLEQVWNSPPDPAPFGAWALSPLSALYGGALSLRPAARARKAPIPIISVGSIWSGGAGKTPLAGALARIGREEGMGPAILMRGYGGKTGRRVARVPSPPGSGDSVRFGDEACLHARRGDACVYVCADRLAAARRAAEDGCRVGILDDGLQHRRLARELEIITLPAVRPFGNGRLLPRGPLREGPQALQRAGIIVLAHVPGSASRIAPPPSLLERLGVPILTWRDEITVRPLITGDRTPPPGAPVVLLCGIARPGTFREAMEDAGYRVAAVEAFPDHHPFARRDCDAARERAAQLGVEWILTTAKDAERLASIVDLQRPTICVAELSMVWSDGEAEMLLRSRLRAIVR